MPADIKPSTFWGLFMEFGTSHIPAIEFADRYLGIDKERARQLIAANRFPLPTFKAQGRKAPSLIDINEAVAYIDGLKEKARQEFNLTH